MKDLVYIYDKETLIRSELGEIQTGFNISNVVDGTKDSCKVEVFNYSKVEIEPNSIIKHEATNTWWVVTHDKVEHIVNDRVSSDELNGDYWYKHNLELLGAIELLNARDLVDSGFNQNRYNVGEFIQRVLKHSNFEFKNNTTIRDNNAIDLNKLVDYVKTFENYTPLSAIREFLDGYNCAYKLSFSETTQSNNVVLNGAYLDIISKTGNVNKEPINDTIFNDVREVGTMDKNSFGTTVISNAQNVISTKAKTYPSIGSVRLSGDEYKIDGSNACIRLPSNIYKVNYIQIGKDTQYFTFHQHSMAATGSKYIGFNPFDRKSVKNAYDEMRTYISTNYPEDLDYFDNTFNLDMLRNYSVITLYNEDNYDPINNTFISTNTQYTFVYYTSAITWENRPLFLTNEELRNNVEKKTGGIYYKRGDNKILGFEWFSQLKNAPFGNGPRVKCEMNFWDGWTDTLENGDKFYIGNRRNENDVSDLYYTYATNYVVNYIPMSDIKIKVDNSGTRKDSQLYNQNGKLTDSVALSKSILSYSKEIESNTITKYGAYRYSYTNDNGTITRNNNIPQVGDLVDINNDIYVINNVSMTFYPSESVDYGTTIEYYVECEFTLSKNIATKSLMVNPNQNIRDYGIPQNFNVKRKQLYRDFYELTYEVESPISGDNQPYLPLNRVFNIGLFYEDYQEHIGIIRLTYDNAYGSDPKNTWYYQLESTTFVMKKSLYEVVDFKDNNIIGYGSQNVWSGWDISRIFSGMTDNINTPISYVDSNGEVRKIEIYFSTISQLESIYEGYKATTAYASDDSVYLENYSVFIPSDIYGIRADGTQNTYGAMNSGKHDFKIEELNYEKDATEVPVFEYACQIDDSDVVIVGDNILERMEDDLCYLYAWVLAPKGKYNENNFGTLDIPNFVLNDLIATCNRAVKLEYTENNEIEISIYSSVSVNVETHEYSYGTQGDLSALDLDNNDLVIVRHTISIDDKPNYYNVLFNINTGIESIYYSLDNGLTWELVLNNKQVSLLENTTLYWYATAKNHYNLASGTPDSEETSVEVIVTDNTTINPIANPAQYLPQGSLINSATGSVKFYPNDSYVHNTEIQSPIDYGTTIYYKIEPASGYQVNPNYSDRGPIVFNSLNFTFTQSTGTKDDFPSCVPQYFNVTFDAPSNSYWGQGGLMYIYYKIGNGSWISIQQQTTISVQGGSILYWYGVADSGYSATPNSYNPASNVIWATTTLKPTITTYVPINVNALWGSSRVDIEVENISQFTVSLTSMIIYSGLGPSRSVTGIPTTLYAPGQGTDTFTGYESGLVIGDSAYLEVDWSYTSAGVTYTGTVSVYR